MNKPRCVAGDVAVVFRENPKFHALGRVVNIVRVDERLCYFKEPLMLKAKRTLAKLKNGELLPIEAGQIAGLWSMPDEYLWPIRPGNGQDEMLRKVGLPPTLLTPTT